METHSPGPRVRIGLAGPEQRQLIYSARHAIYGLELGQYQPNPSRQLTDALDAVNSYIVATLGDDLLAFISITPPGSNYSVDKYFDRSRVPVAFDSGLFEIRLLTVIAESRGSLLAAAMMYAALRYVEACGGHEIVAIGRCEVLDLYLRLGLRSTGLRTQAGKVIYELLTASVSDVRREMPKHEEIVRRIEAQCDWDLPFPFRPSVACEHGGAFWDDVGDDFRSLGKLDVIISADVLDAWFPPAPEVIAALSKNLEQLVRTSPPTDCGGLVRTIAGVRGMPVSNILPAAGSSELIYLAFPRWLTAKSRVLVLDPSYGEYLHLMASVIGCQVDRLPLRKEKRYQLDPGELSDRLARGYDLAVIVNPNSPTGTMISRGELEQVLSNIPNTRVWIDETYIEYAGAEHSLERFAASRENVFVCKSMSKAYALSGVRVAYLVGNAVELARLRSFAPPWSVSLPAQVAAVAALSANEYYQSCYAETTRLREALATELRDRLGFSVVPGEANFLLCHIPEHMLTAAEICSRARQMRVYLRDAGTISSSLGDRALRIAVKDGTKNEIVLHVLQSILGRAAGAA